MSKLTWDLKMYTLSILKRFSFSFLLVFFVFCFFCILDFKSQNDEKCQRVLRSILVLCVVWMFKFAWLHDIIRGKILIFLFKNSCRLIIQSGEVYIYIYLYIYIYIDIYIYIYLYRYIYRYKSRASLEVYCVFLLAFFLGWKHL